MWKLTFGSSIFERASSICSESLDDSDFLGSVLVPFWEASIPFWEWWILLTFFEPVGKHWSDENGTFFETCFWLTCFLDHFIFWGGLIGLIQAFPLTEFHLQPFLPFRSSRVHVWIWSLKIQHVSSFNLQNGMLVKHVNSWNIENPF